jgi:phosphoribosyl 1,2-cyclic phosphate phosphodiesterase
VPVLGCDCSVCKCGLARNSRTRSSIAISWDNHSWLVVDTGPEFRLQALAAGIKVVGGVLYTHVHADHCNGFDDLRAFSFDRPIKIPCYVDREVITDFRSRFSYVFEQTGYKGAKPLIDLIEMNDKEIEVVGKKIEVIRLPHGHVTSCAFRLGRFLYATDFKGFTLEQIEYLTGKIDVMIASGIHFGKHSAHSTIPETMDLFEKIGVKRGILTHLSHEVDYYRDRSLLTGLSEFAYDNMTIETEE